MYQSPFVSLLMLAPSPILSLLPSRPHSQVNPLTPLVTSFPLSPPDCRDWGALQYSKQAAHDQLYSSLKIYIYIL